MKRITLIIVAIILLVTSVNYSKGMENSNVERENILLAILDKNHIELVKTAI